MPNSPARLRRGFIKINRGIKVAKRRDVEASVRITNKGFTAAAQELGSPNGGPGPTYSSGGSSGRPVDRPGFGGVLP